MHWVQYLVLATNLLKAVYDLAAEKARAIKKGEESSKESPEDGMTRTTTSTQDGYLFAIIVMICFISEKKHGLQLDLSRQIFEKLFQRLIIKCTLHSIFVK